MKRWLGSHRFIADDLDAQGIPLQPLPFPGAIYRIANPQSASGATTLFQEMNPPWLLRGAPAEYLHNLLKYRRMNSAIAEEFSLAEPVASPRGCRLLGARRWSCFCAACDDAYEGDHAAAERDFDEQVIRKVRLWEIASGREPTDWVAAGLGEDRETDELLEWEPAGLPN